MVEHRIEEGLPFEVMLGARPESPFEEPQIRQIAYRPTLIIGLGGTGLKVAGKLKKRIRRFFEEERQGIFQLRVFDTDTPGQRPQEERLDPGEFIYLGNIDGNGIVEDLSIHEYIRPWWPKGYRPGFISTGAHTVRCVGRLALFHYIDDKIYTPLVDAIRRAIDVNTAMGIQAQNAKVYIVASLCGGTGGGMLLDMAYIARDLFMQTVPAAYITGVLAMPDAFEPLFTTISSVHRARANTYAALKELDHFTYYKDFKVRYSDVYEITLPAGHRPFNVSYLVGSTNKNAQNVGDIESLAEMAAEEVFLEIASPLRAQEASAFDDVGELDNVSLGKPMAYSSFAVASLSYPLGDIISWCAARDTARLIQDALLHPIADSKAADDAAEAFLRQQRIREAGVDEVLNQLNRDDKGQSLSVEVQLAELEAYEAEDIPVAIGDIESYRDEELDRAYKEMDSRLEELQERNMAALAERVNEFTRSPRRGVVFAGWFLERLGAKVEAQRDEEMVSEAKEWSDRKAKREVTWQDAKEEVDVAVASPDIPIIKGRRIKQAIRDYVSAYNSYLQACQELELRSRAITFYEALKEEIERLDRKLESLIDKLDTTRELAYAASERALVRKRISEGEYVLARSAVDVDELKQLHEKFSPPSETEEDKRSILSKFLNYILAEEPDWSALARAEEKEDEMGKHLYAFLLDHFKKRLGDFDLLDVLEELGGSGRLAEEGLSLFRQAGPFWNYTTVDCPGGRGNISPINLIGYDKVDPADSEWVRQLRDAIPEHFSPVPTNDPRQLTILKTEHGLPLYTFKALRGPCRNAYELYEEQWRRQREGTRPLHASEEWEKLAADLHPGRMEYDETLFAVGFALDLIYETEDGHWYYAKARQEKGKPFKEDHRIAQGLGPALRVFLDKKEAKLDVDRAVRGMMVSAQADTLNRLREFMPGLERLIEESPSNKPYYKKMKAWIERFMKEYPRIL